MNKHHNYSHQVQGEIQDVGIKWAHFVIWTTKDIQIFKVEQDSEWKELYLPMLKDFYMNELMPNFYTKED